MQNKVRTPHCPTYSQVRQVLPLLQGVPKAEVRKMHKAIFEHRGTVRNPVDWSNPDSWIPSLLTGRPYDLAMRIWNGTSKQVNPRYAIWCYSFINLHSLLEPDASGVYRITPQGTDFLNQDAAILRKIDEEEGVAEILRIVAQKDSARRGELVEPWRAYLQKHSTQTAPHAVTGTLTRRLQILEERGLISRRGISYNITQQGLSYLTSIQSEGVERDDLTQRRTVEGAVRGYNERVVGELRSRLHRMKPYDFEHLVGELLEAMGYEDVTVTQARGDMGIDVIAKVIFGITTLTAYIQVKRQTRPINRPTLDQFRGALQSRAAHDKSPITGSLITLGTFSKGCVEAAFIPGALPITLIDGDKLLELLVSYGIGVTKVTLELLELYEDSTDEDLDAQG